MKMPGQALVQLAWRHDAEFHECLTDLESALLLLRERLLELLFGNDARAHEKLSETDLLLPIRFLRQKAHRRVEHVFG